MKGTSVSAVILVAVLSALAGCGTNGGGGGYGGNNNNQLTPPQAQLVGASISNDMSNALSSALLSPAVGLNISSRDHIRAGLQRKNKASTATSPDTVTCGTSTCTISGTYTCPDGGSIEVSGGLTATSTSVSGKITETPSNCSDGTVDINGDPNITTGLQASDNGISTSVSVTLDGGVNFSPVQAGQFPSGSCTCNLTASGAVNDSTGTVTACTVSGSICGQSVNVNCTNLP